MRSDVLLIVAMSDQTTKWRQIAGWAAVVISVVVACLWAFWGSNENFHEGWFYSSFWRNAGLMIAQYLSPMLIVMLVSTIALRRPRLALLIMGGLALAIAWFFKNSRAGIELIVIPLTLLGGLYQFGRPQPRRWAQRLVIGLPLIAAILCGAVPGWRAMHRLDDQNYGLRVIEGNNVTLAWAPEGPGWPSLGGTWQNARQACTHLSADGRTLTDQPQNLWRLPTAEEAVRSLVFRGRNAGGDWDPVLHRTQYRTTPDKDSPLWKVHSQVIYWWTDTEADRDRAYYIASNGYVVPLRKESRRDYLAFRCVREPSQTHMLPANRP